ncbi:MAG TPA: hypothetical protein VLI45_03700 [Acidobacteriaceae bacterium]|nr:hypothetical protein [Acidobacteriaceae bacterium]
MRRKMYVLTILALAAAAGCAFAQTRPAPPISANLTQTLPLGTPQAWVDKAVKHQLAMIQRDALPLRYKMRKIDRRGDITRVVIESQQGTVARMIERNGRPLSSDEDAAERSRLQDILDSPDDFLKRKRRDGEGRDYATQIIKLMPQAMLYTFAPGQPQSPHAKSRQIVVDFTPNPAFHPPTLVSEALTALAGRAWIDEATGHLTRLEGHILHPVNFGWGVLAKVYPGGTVEFEQTCVDGKHWVSSHLVEDVTLREMMVRTVNSKTRMTAWDFEVLPAPLSYQDAVHQLLDMQVPAP